MSKLPEMPKFLNNKDKEELPAHQKEVNIPVESEEPPPLPQEMKKQPPIKPNVVTQKKEESVEKKSWFSRKNKVVSEETEEETTVVKNQKTNEPKSFKQRATQTAIILVGLGLIGSTVHYYLQYKKYEDKYVAIDSKVLSLTKQITSLNQENNQLSGKVVNYQKELENIKEVETNSEAMQDKLIKNETEKKELEVKIQALQDYVLEMETKAKEVIKPIKGKSIPKKVEVKKIIPVVAKPAPEKEVMAEQLKPSPVVETKEPVITEVPKTVEASSPDQLNNYETLMTSEKQIKCKNYFRDETLKRCNDTNKSFDYTLTTEVRKVKINDQEVSKMVYKCVSPTAKDRFFKYGPLEMYNTCKD